MPLDKEIEVINAFVLSGNFPKLYETKESETPVNEDNKIIKKAILGCHSDVCGISCIVCENTNRILNLKKCFDHVLPYVFKQLLVYNSRLVFSHTKAELT